MTTTTRRTRKRRTRRKIGPTPDQQPRRSHPAVDVSGPTAERAGRLSGLWRSAGRWRSAVGPSRARRRRLYRKRWARSRGRPAARATTPGSPSPAFLDNSRRLLSHSCASIYQKRRGARGSRPGSGAGSPPKAARGTVALVRRRARPWARPWAPHAASCTARSVVRCGMFFPVFSRVRRGQTLAKLGRFQAFSAGRRGLGMRDALTGGGRLFMR